MNRELWGSLFLRLDAAGREDIETGGEKCCHSNDPEERADLELGEGRQDTDSGGRGGVCLHFGRSNSFRKLYDFTLSVVLYPLPHPGVKFKPDRLPSQPSHPCFLNQPTRCDESAWRGAKFSAVT
ncbi:hypothetical protein CDAR_523421 [Caerostris darwini]|uniref:Uncharacterized protein n=1 Tax=Caerostris darwini TaxID=1538125 RepID=A0AAV4QQ46_9ARAC|nr:hypothetical protein CDAR_523421 [Caerostris darwini]